MFEAVTCSLPVVEGTYTLGRKSSSISFADDRYDKDSFPSRAYDSSSSVVELMLLLHVLLYARYSVARSL